MSSSASATMAATSTLSTWAAPSGSGSRSGNAGSSARGIAEERGDLRRERRPTRFRPGRPAADDASRVPSSADGRRGIGPPAAWARPGSPPVVDRSPPLRHVASSRDGSRPAARTRAAPRPRACRDRRRQGSCSRIGGPSAGARDGSARRPPCRRHPCPRSGSLGTRTLTWYGLDRDPRTDPLSSPGATERSITAPSRT